MILSFLLTSIAASPIHTAHTITETILLLRSDSCSETNGYVITGSAHHPTTKFPSLFDKRLDRPKIALRALTYIVLAGDTGYSIAAKAGISFETLSSYNPYTNWYALEIGQMLQIPHLLTQSTYTVLAGDTGISIAAKFHVSFDHLQQANPQVSWNNLQIGQQLQIPILSTTSVTNSATQNLTPSNSVSTTASSATPSNMVDQSLYIVMAGDTGYRIASRYGISFETLSSINQGVNWNNLQIGQILNFPSAVIMTTGIVSLSATIVSTIITSSTPVTTMATANQMYEVTAGDTGYEIASRFGVTFDDLSHANPGVMWTNLQIGQILRIPTWPASATTQSTSLPVITQAAEVTTVNAVYDVNNQDSSATPNDQYVFYSGDGSSWPPISSWVSFEEMYLNMKAVLGTNCVGNVLSNTMQETELMFDAIQAVAAASYLDHRFILAVIMQESNGCVRVPTTYSPAPDNIRNPGIMQSFNGVGSCNENGQVSNPCPVQEIFQMVEDGVLGTTGNGLVQNLNRAPGVGAVAFYRAARLYNSGSIPADGDLGGPGASRCFASDIANRLTGWISAPKKCYL